MGKYREVNTELIELAAQGKTGKEISRILNLDYSTVHAKLRKLNINLPNNHNRLKFDNAVFDKIDTEEKAYWLGFLYADGYVSNTKNTVELSLKGDDYNHLVKFNLFIKNEAQVKISESKYNNKIFTRCRCSITDKHFHDTLCLLGCVPKKSLILKFPDSSIFTDRKLVYDFIRGYIDGDGCISYTKTGRLQLSIIGTKEFLDGICNIFPEVFFSNRCKNKRHPESNTYELQCTANKADYVLEILYKDSKIYLDRKYNRLAVLSSNW